MNTVKYPVIFTVLLVTGALSLSAQGMMTRVSDDLELIKLPGNVYIHRSYMEIPSYGRVAANGLVYVARDTAYIVDTPWNDVQTRELVRWILTRLDTEIGGVIVTHSHNDCMGGLGEILRRGIKTYSFTMTREFAARDKLPLPEHTFKGKMELGPEGYEIVAGYYGPGHTADNIVVWIPSERLLFGGCMVKTSGARNLGNVSEADVEAWPHTLRKVLEEYPGARVVVPGHGAHGGIDLITHTLDLLEQSN
jgi:metallo-beta-lactamase class B